MSVSVSVCVSVRDHIFRTTRPIFSNFVIVTYGRGSVLPWRRSDTLCTSSFMDDVAAQLKHSAHADLPINCAQ